MPNNDRTTGQSDAREKVRSTARPGGHRRGRARQSKPAEETYPYQPVDELINCQRAWELGRNPAGVDQAIVLYEKRGAIAPWFSAALRTLLATAYRVEHQAKLARLWERHLQDILDYVRYSEAVSAREHELTWEQAFMFASEILKGTDAFGSPAAMKKSFYKVREVSKVSPGRYYISSNVSRFIQKKYAVPRSRVTEVMRRFLPDR